MTTRMNYYIDYHKCNKYSAIVYSASYVNPFEEILDISLEIKKTLSYGGFVLFDLLLSNGDNFNRFAEAYFDGREIKRDSINIISLDNVKELKQINSYYKGRLAELNNSILTPSERFKYLKV